MNEICLDRKTASKGLRCLPKEKKWPADTSDRFASKCEWTFYIELIAFGFENTCHENEASVAWLVNRIRLDTKLI